MFARESVACLPTPRFGVRGLAVTAAPCRDSVEHGACPGRTCHTPTNTPPSRRIPFGRKLPHVAASGPMGGRVSGRPTPPSQLASVGSDRSRIVRRRDGSPRDFAGDRADRGSCRSGPACIPAPAPIGPHPAAAEAQPGGSDRPAGRDIGQLSIFVPSPFGRPGMRIVIFKGMIEVGQAAATDGADWLSSGRDRPAGFAGARPETDPVAALDRQGDRAIGPPPGPLPDRLATALRTEPTAGSKGSEDGERLEVVARRPPRLDGHGREAPPRPDLASPYRPRMRQWLRLALINGNPSCKG